MVNSCELVTMILASSSHRLTKLLDSFLSVAVKMCPHMAWHLLTAYNLDAKMEDWLYCSLLKKKHQGQSMTSGQDHWSHWIHRKCARWTMELEWNTERSKILAKVRKHICMHLTGWRTVGRLEKFETSRRTERSHHLWANKSTHWKIISVVLA